MNQKAAKALRKLASQVFLAKKMSGDENFKQFEPGVTMWLENTNKRKVTKVNDYNIIPEMDDKGVPVLDVDGKQQMKYNKKLDDSGEEIMVDHTLASGTITVHPLTERGLYRRFKKSYKQNAQDFKNKVNTVKHPIENFEEKHPVVL